MRKTKIICTIGPASENEATLKEMIKSGMNGARINFSHGSWESQIDKVNLVKKLRKSLNKPVAIILDTKGPEIRLGRFMEKVMLEEGSTFTLTKKAVIGTKERASISYKSLAKDIEIGSKILLDDGLIKMEVVDIDNGDITCLVKNSGYISSNKSVNIPDIKLNLPSLTEKDIEDIKGGIKNQVDYIAASFIRRKEDVLAIRKILDEAKSNIKIISKIENREGIENFDEILELSDGIMIARGDLGVEIPFSEVPIVQKEMIKKTMQAGKIVITATQMMESMINEPNPTRAEVSDVANAIFDGTGGIMLSGETAVGKYPVDCIRKMVQIAEDVESSIDYWKRFKTREIPKDNYEFIINHAMLTLGLDINIKAIFCYTYRGDTPRIVASMMPKCPIYVTTSNYSTYNQLSLMWGLNIKYRKEEKEPKKMILEDIRYKLKTGELDKYDVVLIAGGKYMSHKRKEINKSIGGLYQV